MKEPLTKEVLEQKIKDCELLEKGEFDIGHNIAFRIHSISKHVYRNLLENYELPTKKKKKVKVSKTSFNDFNNGNKSMCEKGFDHIEKMFGSFKIDQEVYDKLEEAFEKAVRNDKGGDEIWHVKEVEHLKQKKQLQDEELQRKEELLRNVELLEKQLQKAKEDLLELKKVARDVNFAYCGMLDNDFTGHITRGKK